MATLEIFKWPFLRPSINHFRLLNPIKNNLNFFVSRRQTVQYFNPLLGPSPGIPLSLRDWNQTPSSTICESNEKDLDEKSHKKSSGSGRSSIGGESVLSAGVSAIRQLPQQSRRNLLRNFRTQSFDVKLLSEMERDSVEMERQSQNIIKPGQSTATSSIGGGGSVTAESSTVNNNLMISKKPTGVKKLNYRQSSLDFDNRTSACKLIDNNSNSSLGNKSFLAVPRLQATSRSRSGSAKQLFKQEAIVDEDEQTNENSLLLPETNAISSSQQCIPQLQLPLEGETSKSLSDPHPPISSSSSSSSSVAASHQIKVTAEPVLMHTLTVDDSDVDGNVKKSESCELLRVISERRKLWEKEASICQHQINWWWLIACNLWARTNENFFIFSSIFYFFLFAKKIFSFTKTFL